MMKRGYRDKMRGVESQRIEGLVDAYVHSDRDREIIKMSLVHGISYTRIADIIDPWVSPRTVQSVLNRWMPVILEHIEH
jgi:hypothetical protein